MSLATIGRRAPIELPSSSGALMVVGQNWMASLSNDVIQLIFTRLIKTGDFSAFSETCERMAEISYTIPVYAFPCGLLHKGLIVEDIGYIPTGAFMGGSMGKFVLVRGRIFNEAAEQLIDAVINDSTNIFDPSLKLSNTENEFYESCKTQCFKINTEKKCNRFAFFMFKAVNHLNEIYSKCDIPLMQSKKSLDARMNAALSRLHEKTYNDMVDIITDQLTESVTFDDFKFSAKYLEDIFPDKSALDIEASLRKALKIKYGKAFFAFAIEFSKPYPTGNIVAEIKQQLRAPLEARKAAIEAELAILRGSSGSNGTFGDAYEERETLLNMQDAPIDKNRLERAMRTFHRLYEREHLTSLPKDISVEETLFYTARSRCSAELQNARNELKKALINPLDQKRQAARDKFVRLGARLNKLIQREENTGILIGGELFDVCNKLENINFMAVTKVRQLGAFYIELTRPVTDKNKEARYDSLVALAASWSAN